MAVTNFLKIRPTTEDSVVILLQRVATALARSYGEYGADAFADTTPRTGAWGAITTLTATNFATLTGLTTGSLTGFSIAAGITIYGEFTAITLASGSVHAVRAS